MPLTGLLAAARVVQEHKFYRKRVMEIGHWRIIECDVAVLAKTDKPKIVGRFVQDSGIPFQLGIQVGRISRNKLDAAWVNLVDESGLDPIPEARRVRRWQVHVFIQMEHVNVFPVDVGPRSQRVSKLNLGVTRGHDNSSTTVLSDRLLYDLGSPFSGRLAHRLG